MEDKLRECPFCGSEAEVLEGAIDYAEVVICTGEKCKEELHVWGEGEAVKAWNTRATDPLLQELENAKKAASEWKKRYEGMAILHSNKVRMIEDGDLVYKDNIHESCGCRNTDSLMEKMAEALDKTIKAIIGSANANQVPLHAARVKCEQILKEYREMKDAKQRRDRLFFA